MLIENFAADARQAALRAHQSIADIRPIIPRGWQAWRALIKESAKSEFVQHKREPVASFISSPPPPPRNTMAGTGPSSAGLRRRAGAAGAGANGRTSSDAGRAAAGGSANSFSVRMYADDAPGLKVGPMAVLLTSLAYIAAVVLLHISSKLR